MISNRACEFLIFILPTCLLFGLTTGFLIIMSQDISANLALGLSLGLSIAFGLASIAFAIWFGYVGRLRDFLRDSKRGQVDEKIAIFYGYATDINALLTSPNRHFIIERILSDIRSTGRIKDSMQQSQKEDLFDAIHALLQQMNDSGFTNGADRLDGAVRLWLW